MRVLLLLIAVALCLATATLADEQQKQQQDEFDQQQEELRRNLAAMELLASQAQASADKFRAEQRLWEQATADAAQLEQQQQHLQMQQDQEQMPREQHMQRLEHQEQQLHQLEQQYAQLSDTVRSNFNETIFTDPFVLPMHQTLQIPHCFTPGSECTLAFWIWLAPDEDLMRESMDHSLVSIISSNLPPGLLSPILLLGVAPDKLKPFLSINGLSNGALVGVFSHSALKPQRWTHLALSLDPHALSLFVNGKRTAVLPLGVSTPPTSSSSMIEHGRIPPSDVQLSTFGSEHSSDKENNPLDWTAEGCGQCRLWPFNITLGFGGNRLTPAADAAIARAVLYNTNMDDSGALNLNELVFQPLIFAMSYAFARSRSYFLIVFAGTHSAVMDMKTMKHSGKKGDGPLSWEFPKQTSAIHEIEGAAHSDDDTDVESDVDLPMVLSQEIMEAGGEGIFFSGNLMRNFLNATGGSSDGPALPLLGVAYQHLLPPELRDVTLPPPVPVDAVSLLPPRPPLPPGVGFVIVSADTRAEVLAFPLFNSSM